MIQSFVLLLLGSMLAHGGVGTWTQVPMDSTIGPCILYPFSTDTMVCTTHYTLNGGQDWLSYSQPEGNFLLAPWSVSTDNPPRVSYFTGGMYRNSDDFGQSWAGDSSSAGVSLVDFAVDLTDSAMVWGGTDGFAIHRSLNFGTTWSRRSEGLSDNMSALCLAQSPINTDQFIFGGSSGQGYCVGRSEDHGETWFITHDSFPPNESSILWRPTDIQYSPLVDSLVVIATQDVWDGSAGRVYRSLDAGTTWERVQLPEEENVWMTEFAKFHFHPTNPDVIYFSVGGSIGITDLPSLLRSQDRGATWSVLGENQPMSLGLAHSNINRLDPPTLIITVGGLEGVVTSVYTDTIGMTTRVPDLLLPSGFSLDRVAPNPFNPSTTLTFTLSHGQHVELSVFDLRGRRVRTLVSGWQESGEHRVTFHGDGLASGVYLVRLASAGQNETRKVLLLK